MFIIKFMGLIWASSITSVTLVQPKVLSKEHVFKIDNIFSGCKLYKRSKCVLSSTFYAIMWHLLIKIVRNNKDQKEKPAYIKCCLWLATHVSVKKEPNCKNCIISGNIILSQYIQWPPAFGERRATALEERRATAVELGKSLTRVFCIGVDETWHLCCCCSVSPPPLPISPPHPSLPFSVFVYSYNLLSGDQVYSDVGTHTEEDNPDINTG